MSRAWIAAGVLALAAACSDILVQPATRPAGLALSLAPGAVTGLAPSLVPAFDEADSARVVLLVDGEFSGSNPFAATTGRLADTTVSFAASDTVRLSVELEDSVVADTLDVVMGLMLKAGGEPLFVFVDSLVLIPNEVARSAVPFLFPVPAGVSVTAAADSLDPNGATTTVVATGLLTTGDTIPEDQFFPDFQSLDPTHLTVVDEGTTGLVSSIDPGPGRIQARVQSLQGTFTDTVTIVVRPPPPPADTAAFAQLALGGSFACALDADGAAFCWGSNSSGAFGNGGYASSTTPVAAGGGMTFTQLTAGTGHVCGVATDDVLYCWGSNARGQLGIGSAGGSSPAPAAVAGGPWAMISAGDTHTCAIDTADVLFCWGANDRGQIGVGGLATDRDEPAQVGHDAWSYVSAGTGRSCGVTADGTGLCWGRGNDGGLGNGTLADAFTPVPVAEGSWTRIRAGRDHTCGIQTDGSLHCWGRNNAGQLGLSAGGGVYDTPQATALQAPLLWLDPGSQHTCVVLQADGAYTCWGSDSQGQLGAQDPPDPGWAAIDASAQSDFTCAIRAGDGKAFCWGDGSLGRLGNGSTFDSPLPVPVVGSADDAAVTAR